MAVPIKTLLNHLEPLARLSPSRQQELADLCFIETVSKDIDPLRMNVSQSSQAIYLLSGFLSINYADGRSIILKAGSPAAKHALKIDSYVKDTRALTEIEILRVDTDLLDIMMTWDQLSTGDAKPQQPESKPDNRSTADWMHDTSVFSVEKLQKGTFSHLPAANVEEMFKRMTSLAVRAGQTIIQQGAEGDYYYLIEKGTAAVTKRMELGQPPVLLAELNAGSAFGEEALVSDNKRNATVTMNTAGELLRLSKKDFVELLKEPLLTQLSYAEAQVRVSSGAVWADVRLPSEFNFDHLQGAINLPLNEIRSVATGLDKTKTYVLYCQTGRRSSAAAFVLTQLGFEVLVLKGGTRANGL